MLDKPRTLTDFKEKLMSIGYQPFQIELIVKETVGETDAAELNEQEQSVICDAFERYFSFANKCRSMRNARTGTMEWST